MPSAVHPLLLPVPDAVRAGGQCPGEEQARVVALDVPRPALGAHCARVPSVALAVPGADAKAASVPATHLSGAVRGKGEATRDYYSEEAERERE